METGRYEVECSCGRRITPGQPGHPARCECGQLYEYKADMPAGQDNEPSERQQVEAVFSLTGGELEDEPWEIEGWTFHYWYPFPPEYVEKEYDPTAHEYRTVVRDDLFGEPPTRLGPWLKVARFGSSGETEVIGEDGNGTGEYLYLGDGWGENVYRFEPERATAEEAGCWVDGHWGQYGLAHLITKAEDYGYPNAEDIALAHKHLASMGPSTSPDLTDDEYERLVESGDDVEEWLNQYVAPEGYSFGWWEGEFFLSSEEDWEASE